MPRGPTLLATGTGANAVNVGSNGRIQPIARGLTIAGGGTDTVNIDDSLDGAARTGTLSASNLLGLGLSDAGIGYASIENLSVALGSGNVNLTITGTAAGTTTAVATGDGNDTVNLLATGLTPTSIQTGGGNDTVNVRTISGATAIGVGTGTNVTNVGTLAPVTGGTLASLAAPLTLTGGGSDTINLDASGDTAARTAALTATDLTGLGTAGISFGGDAGLVALNLTLGGGADALTVDGTPTAAVTSIDTGAAGDTITVLNTTGVTNINAAGGDDAIAIRATGAPTNVNTGTGTNTVRVASASPTTLDGIQGALLVAGNASDTLNIDDSGNLVARTGTLTADGLTGFGMAAAGLSYTGLGTLNLKLGNGGAGLTVADTAAGTTTNILGTVGNDAITIAATSGVTNVATSNGRNAIVVQGTGAATNITGAAGARNAITVAKDAKVAGVLGLLTLAGKGADVVLIDDSAATVAKTAELTPIALKGLSGADIAYAGLAELTINLGKGANGFTLANTAAGTNTKINGGTGNANVTVNNVSGPTRIATGAATNVVRVRATSAALAIASGVGAADAITLGDNGNVDAITAAIAIAGNAATVLTVDDAANTNVKTASLSATALTGLAPAAIAYNALATLNVNFGTAGDVLSVSNTAAGTTTNLAMAGGDDAVTVLAATGVLNVNAGTGSNTVGVQTTNAAVNITTPANGATTTTLGKNGLTDGLRAAVSVNGSNADALIVDAAAVSLKQTVTLTPTGITGASQTPIAYAGLSTLTLNLGTPGDAVTVTGTAPGTATTVNAGPGNDAIRVRATAGPLTLNNGAGVNAVTLTGLTDATLAAIAGNVTVNGNGQDSLTLDDSADNAARTPTLSATTITGIAPATVAYAGLGSLAISLGSAADDVTVTATAAGAVTSLNTGAGANRVSIGNAGIVDGIAGAFSLTGSGNDAVFLNDGNNTAGKTVTLRPAGPLGLTPGSLNYAGVSAVTLTLGSGNDTVTVPQTIAGSTLIRTAGGNDAVNVRATTGTTTVETGTGADLVTVGSLAPTAGGTLDGIAGPLTVTGGGNATLTLDDAGSAAARNLRVAATTVTGLSPAAVSYSGLVALNVNLGAGNDDVRVNATAAGTTTTIRAGGGNDTLDVVAPANAAPFAPGALPGNLAGPLVLDGGAGANPLRVDNRIDTVGRTVTVVPGSITGLGASIGYANVSKLDVLLGAASDTLNLDGLDPAVPTNVDSGPGADVSNVIVTGNYAGGLKLDDLVGGSLSVTGDFAGTLPIAGGMTSLSIGGNLLGDVNLTGDLGSLSVGGNLAGNVSVGGKLGSVAVNGTQTGAIDVGSDLAALTVRGDLAGPVTVGGKLDAAVIDGSLNTPLNVAGDLGSLTVGGDLVSNVAVGGKSNAISVNGSLRGNVAVTGTLGALTVRGDLTGTVAASGPTSAVTIGGGTSGTLALRGDVGTLSVAGDAGGTLDLRGDLGTLSVGGSLTGTVTVAGKLTAANISGNVAGVLEVGGDLIAGTIGGSLLPAAHVTVEGAIGTLNVAGSTGGTIAGRTIGVVTVGRAIADPAGLAFAVTQAGITRTIHALAAEGASLASTTFGVVYEGTNAARPQAAVRIAGTASGRFDLTLEGPSSARFDLARLDAADGATAQAALRNVNVGGSILGAVTNVQAGHFAYAPESTGKPVKKVKKGVIAPARAAAGIVLPGANLGVVAARDEMRVGMLRADSVQGVAFAGFVDAKGNRFAGTEAICTSKGAKQKLLTSVLAVNPATKKPYARIALAAETLRVSIGSELNVILFAGAGGSGAGRFDPRGVKLSDQSTDGAPVTAFVDFVQGANPNLMAVRAARFEGDGGSIDTYVTVGDVTSNGVLGEVIRRGTKK